MVIACCVCAAVYLARSSGHSLISSDCGGIPACKAAPSLLLQPLHQQGRGGGKTGVGGNKRRNVQTGRGCNFLRKLSEPFPVWPIRWEKKESMKERRRREKGEKCSVSVRNMTGKGVMTWTWPPLGSAFTWDEKRKLRAKHEWNPEKHEMRNKEKRRLLGRKCWVQVLRCLQTSAFWLESYRWYVQLWTNELEE